LLFFMFLPFRPYRCMDCMSRLWGWRWSRARRYQVLPTGDADVGTESVD
jgi:hypothetical protein